jgi:hypothetical protein
LLAFAAPAHSRCRSADLFHGLLRTLCFRANPPSFRLEVAPEFLRDRNIVTGCQAFEQQRLQTSVLFLRLGLAQQGAEVFADVAVALMRELVIFRDSGSEMVTVVTDAT